MLFGRCGVGGRLVSSFVVVTLGAAGLVAGPASRASGLPNGFVVDSVVSGLDLPVAIAFGGGGRMFIAEKSGVVRVFRDGALLPTPFVDLSTDVNSFHERGLLGMTVHPNFPVVPYVYVLYTYDPPGVNLDDTGARVARLERISADASNPDVAATGAGARMVLLGVNGDASVIPDPLAEPSLSCWVNNARVQDCIPQDKNSHGVGTVRFGADGALYVGNGDVSRLPDGPQDPANMIGAIMRIDASTGAGLADNPFYDGDPTSNISKVWAHGLRNPFRFGVDSVSGQMIIGDVGQGSWESLQVGVAGKNYGWPCYEGGRHVYGVYQNTALCQGVYAAGPRVPLYDYAHTDDGGSVTAGDWYHGTEYPAQYQGAHFFADYSQGWVKYLQPNGTGGYTTNDFAADGAFGGTTSGIVNIIAGPGGDLYWVSINNGAVYRLRYGGPVPLTPLALHVPFDEGSGTSAADVSGGGNDAQLLNGAGWMTAGKFGSALSLSGGTDVAAIADSTGLNQFTNELSVSAWVYRPATQTGWRAIVARQYATASADQFVLGFKDGVPKFGINTIIGGKVNVGSGSAGYGQWVHMAGVYDGTMMRLYVNGVERASLAKTGEIVTSARPLLIGGNANGADPLAATETLVGNIDDVQIYNRALSAPEVAELANPVAPPQVSITLPTTAAEFFTNVGTTVNFAATATDPLDGNLTSQISWDAAMHHNVHTHPDYLPPTSGGSGSLVFDDHGDDTFLRLCATVTNAGGKSATDCVDLKPNTTTVSINSIPSGQPVTFGDTTQITPFSAISNITSTRVLSAALSSGCYEFDSWSDGGAATHDVIIGAAPATYTANFTATCVGPVARIPFDEGSGTNAADVSGGGNDAQLLNGAGWGVGRAGSALSVTSGPDIAAISNSAGLNQFTNALSVSAWVFRPAAQTGWRSLVSRQYSTGASDQFVLSFKGGIPKFGINTSVGGNQSVGSGSSVYGKWVHLVGVYDGAMMRLYVNGKLRASLAKTGTIVTSDRPVLVGGNANGTNPLTATQAISGRIDEVRLYRRALSAAEITTLYTTPAAP